MCVCCDCRMMSGRVLYYELITRPEESYRLWCVVVCSLNLVNEEALAHCGLLRQRKFRSMQFLFIKAPSDQRSDQ